MADKGLPPKPPGRGDSAPRLTSANLLQPASYKTVGGSVGGTPRATPPASPSSSRRNSEADQAILAELERLSTIPAGGSNPAGPPAVLSSLRINTLGPKVLSHQHPGGQQRPARHVDIVSARPAATAGAAGRGSATDRQLKPSMGARHGQRSPSPARGAVSNRSPSPRDSVAADVDRSAPMRSEEPPPPLPEVSQQSVGPDRSGLSSALGSARGKAALQQAAQQPPGTAATAARPGSRARTAQSMAESDMDSHLPPERNLWLVLEKLRLRPERAEFRYMMQYKKDAFTPLNPYHLQVLPLESVDRNNYFTLSLHGVTHFLGGVPQFLELEEWKRERFLFDSVIQIPVIARYLWWKPFRLWKNWVKRSKFAATKRFLEKNLIVANPTLLAALHQLRISCFGLSAVPLCSDAAEGMHTLNKFSALQEKQRGMVLRHHEAFWAETFNNVKMACTKVLQLLDEDFAKQQAEAQQKQKSGLASVAHATVMKVDIKADNIRIPQQEGEKEKPDFKYTLIAAKRAMHRLLHNYMRMCDYIVFASLLDLVVSSVQGLCDRFEGEDLQVMFTCDLSMEEDGDLVHRPNDLEFATEVDGIANSFVVTASTGHRLLNHAEVIPLLDLIEPEEDMSENLVYNMITHDARYQRLIDQLHVTCRREFRRCNVALDFFRPVVKEVMDSNAEFDCAALEEEAEKSRSDFSEFILMIADFRAQIGGIDDVPPYKDYGVVRVRLDTFKMQVWPTPNRCLKQLEEMLPRILSRRQKRQSTELEQFSHGLSRIPRTVEDFVAFVQFIDKVDARQADIDNEISMLEEEYHQMESANVKFTSEEDASYRMLFAELMSMRTSFEIAENQRQLNADKWAKNLAEQVAEFKVNVNEIKMLVDDPSILDNQDPATIWDRVEEMSEMTQDLKAQVVSLQEQGEQLKSFQLALKRPVDSFPDLVRVSADIQLKSSVWETFTEIKIQREKWRVLDLEDIESLKALEAQCLQWYRIALRGGRDLPDNKVVPILLKETTLLRSLAGCCLDLSNLSMKDRHWDRVYAATGIKLNPTEFTSENPRTVSHILNCGAVPHSEAIQKISVEATQEQMLEEMMGKIKGMWIDAEFEIKTYKDHNDVYILGGVEEVQQIMDESMTMIGIITASRYVGGVRAEVDKLEYSLTTLQSTMDEWLAVQQLWLYLEPVLTAPDIQRQLPSESKLFLFVDHEYKAIMRRASENPNCLRVGNVAGQKQMFEQLLDVLEKVQKSLEDYLEFKRTAFPRFYFLSNDELLEILAETRLVQAVQPHMIKCFDAIKSLDFGGQHPLSPVEALDEMSVDIYGMISPEGEYVTLGKALKARGEVEMWLSTVEKRMVDSLRQLARECITDYQARPREEWILMHASQLLIMASQIFWCQGAEEAMAGDDVANKLTIQLESHLQILKQECGLVRKDLNALQRCQCVSLITIDVHNRDILESMIADGIASKTQFAWQMRMRYYWVDAMGPIGDCRIEQVMAGFTYAYEYLGASGRLVVTELTDRCYMTLTGAMDLMLGGAPAGPAGTGKTETTKDLGKALGRQCVVFNCGENLDAAFMRKFFKGLAQCGAWACFDEFNRIELDVLSVIAQQVICIQQALRAGVSDFDFEGKTIRLVHTFGVFITMNPGYAGRSELPDNLKALFRPISMMVPDYALVAEVMLFAEGFDSAKMLSQKMVKLYKLSSEQLSQAKHYDFGMRAVKSVLVMAGARKRAAVGQSEDTILIAAMCDSNVPKFEKQDKDLFFAIVGDLFPGTDMKKRLEDDLSKALVKSLSEGALQCKPEFVHKGVELFETINIRFGVLCLGPSGGGKTTLTFALRHAVSEMHSYQWMNNKANAHPNVRKTRIYCFNPKSISLGELYGNYSPATNEWSDGLASSLVRIANNDTTDDKKWVLFDGPIDAVWVENMNTVLDDNQTLCLPNGERIKLSSNLRMLFECENVTQASPATVSRLGVVFLPAATLGCIALVETWLAINIPEDIGEGSKVSLHRLLIMSLPSAIDFVRRECREDVPSVDFNLTASCCALFGSLLRRMIEAKPETMKKGGNKERHTLFENLQDALVSDSDLQDAIKIAFSFALVWSVGANIDAESKTKFDDWFRELAGDIRRFPNFGDVYDYVVDTNTVNFVQFADKCPAFTYNPAQSFSEMLVPTADTTKYSHLLTLLCQVDRNVLLVGHSGTGKSVMMADALNVTLPQHDVVSYTINFSAQTSSQRVQEMLESHFKVQRKHVLGAMPGKRLVCFVDDVNMPQREVYGAQPPIELLRQVVDRSHHYRPGQGKNPPFAGGCGIYDRKKHFWNDILDFVLMAACGPPGGGRNPVCPRFFRHFAMINVPPASPEVLKVIFMSILEGHLNAGDFLKEVKGLSRGVVDSSIELYGRISTELLPTPDKSHYTFNIRDLSKVFQGMLSLQAVNCSGSKTLIRLWIHESQRVFQDRLVDETDKKWFETLLHELLKRKLGASWDFDETFVTNKPMFGDFLVVGAGPEEKQYKEVTDQSALPKLMESYLAEYNLSTNKVMSLIFFRDAIEHVSRICRILRAPRGNAILVGMGGSGRQSLSRVAAFICDCQCRELEVTKGYGMVEFREDLKKLFQTTGVRRKPVVLLITDSQIVNEGFLEDINGILNTGEVPNLFSNDDKVQIANELKDLCLAKGLPATKDSAYSLFIQNAQANLHVVLCMSQIGDTFRTRCRQFPSLINCCTLDWFLPWPEDALLGVGRQLLTGRSRDKHGLYKPNIEGVAPEALEALASFCVTVHSNIGETAQRFWMELRRRFYISPKSFLDMIQSFIELLREKRGQLNERRNKFVNGLQKMAEVAIVIEQSRHELNDLRPVLEEKGFALARLLLVVQTDKDAAQKERERMAEETALVEAQADKVRAIQADAQKDLDEALPALEGAIRALNSLTKGDIVEVKSFAKPPVLVQTVMEAVCVLLHLPTTWDSAKKVLGQSDFMDQLLNYEKDHIEPRTIRLLKKYIENPEFVPEVVGKVSKAAKGLCMWCRAMNTYAAVVREVEPKKARLKEADSELATAQHHLDMKSAELAQTEERVAGLEEKLTEANKEEQNLRDQAKLCEDRLSRATRLTAALGDEQTAWKHLSVDLELQLERIAGDVMMASACISYYAPLSATYREKLVQSWLERCEELKIQVSQDFSVRATLATDFEVREWTIHGLPSNQLSVDNGVVVMNCRRWPLMIDPQLQAGKWMKSMYEAKGKLRVTRLSDPSWIKVLETSIINGLGLVIEDLGETLDPALTPVLLKQHFLSGGRQLIKLGEMEIDYDPEFRLYLMTKQPNPHFLPEVCIQTTLVNFTVTHDGLEDQLLGDVVRKERPDLEAQRDKIIVSMASDTKQLQDLQDKALQLLFESEGMILDNEPLVNTLQQSKATSIIIEKRFKEAEATEESIKKAREEYRIVAKRASLIYFVVADLALLNPMYQYSLEYFKRLYSYCIDTSEKSASLGERLATLLSFVTSFMYTSVCRGLFEQHKAIFSFLICTAIQRDAQFISFNEWNFFLRGARPSATAVKIENPCPQHSEPLFDDTAWSLLTALEQLYFDCPYEGLRESISFSILQGSSDWKEWLECPDPFGQPPPAPWGEKLQGFKRLLLIRATRMEKVFFASSSFVSQSLGHSFTESPPMRLHEIFPDTSSETPIIFLLVSGSDPTAMIFKFAEERRFLDRLHSISLGQGQGPIAEKLIALAAKNGDWVCLMNCHVSAPWLPTLESIVGELVQGAHTGSAKAPDTSFRIWLTSMPSSSFPVSILQVGIKLTCEPPKGLRSNIVGTFSDLGEEVYEQSSNPASWKKLLVSLAFFHAVVQERRKYGPIGWNIRYEFNNSDFVCARDVLRMFVEKAAEEEQPIPWEALSYVTGQINYGGRVTDAMDRRCLIATLERYYRPDVLKAENYKLSVSGAYYVPDAGTFEDLMAYLHVLPDNDDPEVFGMHDNANLAFQLRETERLIAESLSIQPREPPREGELTAEAKVDQMCDSLLARLPKPLVSKYGDARKAESFDSRPKTSHPDSFATVLEQEVDRFHVLAAALSRSLVELKKAIKGVVVMSDELESMFNSLSNNLVPGLWSKVSYLSLKPLGAWMDDHIRRVRFFQVWLNTGTPACFWISGFFFPQGFLTAALQSHARRYRCAVDTLSFSFTVRVMEQGDDVNHGPEDGVFVDGMFLEGARWDRKLKKLRPGHPGQLLSSVPIIHFRPREDYTLPPEDYHCPLYKTNERAGVLSTTGQSTNFILTVALPTDVKPKVWVLQGTAMVTMANT